MQSFKAFHFFLFATSALLLAQTLKNPYISIAFYMIALVLYVLAWIKFNKEKKQ
jgi:hypothetical protein